MSLEQEEIIRAVVPLQSAATSTLSSSERSPLEEGRSDFPVELSDL